MKHHGFSVWCRMVRRSAYGVIGFAVIFGGVLLISGCTASYSRAPAEVGPIIQPTAVQLSRHGWDG